MKKQIGFMALIAVMFTLGCSQKPAPRNLLDELAQKQQKDRVGIGWVYEHKLNLIMFGAKPEMREYSLPADEAQKLAAARETPTQISEGTDVMRSPDRKAMTYRTRENRFVLADASGKIERTLADGRRVLTPVYWSPDSQYLFYVQKAGTWDPAGLHCGDDAFYVMVYRLRDGSTGPVFQGCQGYPFGGFQWLRVPSNVPLS
ncbi:MAG TPA: hypothetical protein VFA89_03810 [Terriglobales bacterium]|nr:hypothetical protein [Terriglobales bacterium]